jgi:hypothetical protein
MDERNERANECRWRANGCRLAAELTDNPSNRADYLALAHQWETRARQIEQPDPRDRLQD